MLLLVGTDPMRFVAVCDTCGGREGPLDGSREDAARRFVELAWRLDERFTKAAICAKCAGPPSIFPAARVSAEPHCCTECKAVIDRCAVCHDELREGEVISCRRTHGHAHPRCATQKVRKLDP